MWRKNRRPSTATKSPQSAMRCSGLTSVESGETSRLQIVGVDLNRNFDWYWSSECEEARSLAANMRLAATGASSDPCHDTYHGTLAFSEPESRAVRDFLERNPAFVFVTMHRRVAHHIDATSGDLARLQLLATLADSVRPRQARVSSRFPVGAQAARAQGDQGAHTPLRDAIFGRHRRRSHV